MALILACGLLIDSALPDLPGEVCRAGKPIAQLRVREYSDNSGVRQGVSLGGDGASVQGYYCESERKVHVDVGGEMWIEITDADIEVATAPTVSKQVVAFHAMYHGVALLTALRGAMVLHGAAVEMGGMAICIVGGRGVGKSSLACYLSRRGFGFMGDDFIPVVASRTWGSFPLVRLAEDAAIRLLPGSARGGGNLRWRWHDVSGWGKYRSGTHDIASVVILRRERTGIRARRLLAADAYRAVMANVCAPYGLPSHVWPGIARACGDLVRSRPVLEVAWSQEWHMLPRMEEALLELAAEVHIR